MRRTLLLMLCTAFMLGGLSACGFSLNTKTLHSPYTLYVHMADPDTVFADRLKRMMQAEGIVFASSSEVTPLTLSISPYTQTLSDSNIAAGSQTHVHTITGSIHVSVQNAQGKTLVPDKTFAATFSVILARNQLLTTNNQTITATHEVQTALLIQLQYYLSSQQMRQLYHENIP